jgi:CHAT domain-containing protein/tetratricopeptide (TPR) repeat protein
MKSIFGLLICMMFCTQGYSQSKFQEKQVDATLSTWRSWLKDGRWQEVLDSTERLWTALPPGTSTALKATILSLKGSALRHAERYDEAIAIQQTVLQMRLKALGPRHEETANTCMNIGNCFLDLDRPAEAGKYLLQALSVKRRLYPTDHPRLQNLYNSLGLYYKASGKYPESRKYLELALLIAERQYGPNSIQLNGKLLSIGDLHIEQNRQHQAIPYLERAMRIQRDSAGLTGEAAVTIAKSLANAYQAVGRQAEAMALLGQVMKNMDAGAGQMFSWKGNALLIYANCLLDLGDFKGAEQTLQAAKGYYLGKPFLLAAVYNSLGLANRYLGERSLAIDAFAESVDQYQRAPGHFRTQLGLAAVFQNLGSCYLDEQNYGAALGYFRKSLAMFEPLPDTKAQQAACWDKIAGCYLKNKSGAQAKLAIDQAERLLPDGQPALRFSIYFNRGELAQLGKQWTLAEYWYQKALQTIQSPAMAAWIPFPYETIQAEVALAKVCREEARESGAAGAWERVLGYAKEAINWLDLLKSRLKAEDSSPALQQIFHTPFDLAVTASLALGRPEAAWAYSEQFKSNFLQKLARAAQARAGSGSISALSGPEDYFSRKLAYFQRLRYEVATTNQFDETTLAAMDDSIRRISDARYEARSAMLKQNPGFYEAFYQPVQPDLQQVRQALRPGQTLLEFHWTEDSIYRFVVTADALHVSSAAGDTSVENAVLRYYQLCSTNPGFLPDSIQMRTFRELTELGVHLYQALIEPVNQWLGPDVMLVPDGALCYLPFEALIVKPGKALHHFNTHHYLFQDHHIGYVHSAGTLAVLKGRNTHPAGESLLAVAPDFDGTTLHLKPLLNNLPEAQAAGDILHGDVLKGSDAAKSKFLTLAPQYRVLLLSTHAVMNDQTPEASYVAFSIRPETAKDNLLYVFDIYNQPLHADLVVLSACQTASGRLYRGEGLQSIAKAFQYAGAQGLMASLWNVDDQQTPGLIRTFFEGIEQELPKSVALARAKQVYLEQNRGLAAHPYYWAGFEIIGDDAALRRAGWGWYWGLVLAGGVTIGAGVWYWSRRQILPPPAPSHHSR